MIRKLCIITSSFFFLCFSASAEELSLPGFNYREYREIKLSKGTAKTAEAKVRIEIECLSERGTRDQYFPVYDQWGATVDKVTAKFNEKKKNELVSSFRPKRRDVFFSEERIWIVSLPKLLKVGDVVSYEYTVKYDNLTYVDLLRLPNVEFMEHYEVEFETPSDVTIEVEWFFPADSIKFKTERINDKRFRLVADSIPKQRHLPNSYYRELHALGLISYHKEGDLLTPSSPEKFVKWYSERMPFSVDSGALIDSMVIPEIETALDTVSDKMTSLKIIHDFVRGNIRYVADAAPPHTIFPHLPTEVLSRRYGDCKDRAFLVTALAAHYGIKVYPCVVSGIPFRPLNGLHVSMFNHMICAVESEEGLFFFDPTPTYYPMGTLPPSEVGCFALILDQERPRIETVSQRDTLPDLEILLTGRVDSSDQMRADIKVRGGYRSEVLNAQDRLTSYEFRQFLAVRLPVYLFRIGLDNFNLNEIDEKTLALTATADLSAFLVKSPASVYFPMNPFLTIEHDILERETDSRPIMAGIPRCYSLTLDLKAPGFEADSDSLYLAAGRLAELYGKMRQPEYGRFLIDYRYRLRVAIVRDDQRETYLEFCRSTLDSKQKLFKLDEGENR